jgi:hypothetical protein
MKVTSLNFIKMDDVPKQVKNTELGQVCHQVADALDKIPNGQALQLKLDTSKRWTTYALKRALWERHKLNTSMVSRGDGIIYIMLVKGQPGQKAK